MEQKSPNILDRKVSLLFNQIPGQTFFHIGKMCSVVAHTITFRTIKISNLAYFYKCVYVCVRA
jgi:hypothetical protein